MEYIHTVKKYTVLLTTEEIMECDNLKFYMTQFAVVFVGEMKNLPHISTKILTGGKAVSKEGRLSSRWERSNPFPFYFCKIFRRVDFI